MNLRAWRLTGTLFYWLSLPILVVLVPFTRRTRILVWSGDELLVVQPWHGDGSYKLPGGGIKWKEDARLAAQRELIEETGIDQSLDQSIGNDKCYVHGVLSRLLVFELRLPSRLEVTSRPFEITGHKWLHKDRVLQDRTVNSEVRQLYLKYGKI